MTSLDELLDKLKFDDKGLVTAVAQDYKTGTFTTLVVFFSNSIS